jgi:hypothetical protein
MLLGSVADVDSGWLKGVTDFLLQGLSALAQEFPRDVAVRIETTEV